MLLLLAPWLTSAGALTQLATVRRWPIFAFALGLAYQPIWVAYAFQVHGYGFLLATAGFVAVNAWQLRKAILERMTRGSRGWDGVPWHVVADGHIEEESDAA